MAKIPLDLITEILLRVPVKSLMRARCVSKQLCSLIDCPGFRNLHITRSRETKTNLFIIFDHGGYVVFRGFKPSSKATGNPLPSKSLKGIMGTCNGLIALFYRSQEFIMWNPLTGKVRKLPHGKFYHNIPTQANQKSCAYGFGYGFGYDRYSDDYKLFKCVQEEAEVFSLRKNSWRKIEGIPNYLDANVDGGGVLVGGTTLHWAVPRKPSPDRKIVAFDLVKEGFHVVPLLEYFGADFVMNVGELDGCLCMAADFRAHGAGVEFWVMKEYGVVESWIKVFSLSPDVVEKPVYSSDDEVVFLAYSSDAVVPLAYWKSDAKVLVCMNAKLFWYDTVKKTLELFNDRPYALKPWLLVRSSAALR